MAESVRGRIQVFDPKQDYAVVERRLPHWSQAGTIAFITWRTWDSIPAHVLESWLAERADWLRRHGIDPDATDCEAKLQRLEARLVREFKSFLSDRWNEHLDDCHGTCILRRPEPAHIVADSLTHFDGQQYDLTDFVIMPNHVHLLAAFSDEGAMLKQCESWKHFTATKLNRWLQRDGRFWQRDAFDHLVRSAEQFDQLRRYISENPQRARLQPGEFRHWSKQL